MIPLTWQTQIETFTPISMKELYYYLSSTRHTSMPTMPTLHYSMLCVCNAYVMYNNEYNTVINVILFIVCVYLIELLYVLSCFVLIIFVSYRVGDFNIIVFSFGSGTTMTRQITMTLYN